MKLINESGEVLISVSELVAISRRHLSAIYTPHTEEGRDGEIRLSEKIELPSATLLLEGSASVGERGELICTATLPRGRTSPNKEIIKQARGELFILGYMYILKNGKESVTLTARYCDTGGKILREDTEESGTAALAKFYSSCISAIEKYAPYEIQRVMERLPSQRNVKFPYGAVRDGQSELVRRVYRSIAKGGELFISAPTGTGKTVSVIYPAIRALGDGRCERVFYLTPKTTTANAAADCLRLLHEGGADIRAVRITAKEKICEFRTVCKSDPDACRCSQLGGIPEAVLALSALGKCAPDEEDIRAVAREYNVCPYELSLCYAESCEFIICDVNYVFDPSVYLRRFFDNYSNSALLIDEAHNLVSRAREMYSEELSTEEITALSEGGAALGLSEEFTESLLRISSALKELLLPYLSENTREDGRGVTVSAEHLSYIPSEMYGLIEALRELTEEELMLHIRRKSPEKAAWVALIKDFLRKLSKLCAILELFDEGFRLLLFLDGERIKFKLFCIDTGNVLRARLSRLRSAVFFSATLEPESYYRDALGGDRSADTASVSSPFDPSSLSVTIMDKISTRVSERERTKDAVCRVIAATLSARRGHYMVYAPSFEYAEMLFRTFTEKYPKVKARLHTPDMTSAERAEFIRCFDTERGSYLIGFSVLGGIYSEGIDLAGESLIGAIVVGIGMPQISYEGEAIAEYYDGKLDEGRQYAYIYPGMNKVFQAAGRVIRREDDRGVIVLIDDRFDDPIYKKSIPGLWRGMRYCSDPKALRVILDDFWRRVDGEKLI